MQLLQSSYISWSLTQGSGLRPQPWAVESQLLQSCRCLRSVLKKPLSGSPQGERIEAPSQIFTMGREFVLAVFDEVVVGSFPLGKAGMGHYFATAVTMSAGSYLMIRELVTYVTWSRALCYEGSCLMIRSWRCGLLAPRLPFRAPPYHLLRRNHPPVACQFHPNMQKHGGEWRFNR